MSTSDPGKAVLSAQNIVMSYGAQPILDGASLTIHEGDRIGLIGRNGSGKSTLLQILAGHVTADSGIVTRSQGLRVALLTQDCRLERSKTVGETLFAAAADLRAMVVAYHDAMERLAVTPGDCWEHRELQVECDALQHALHISGAWDLDHETKRVSMALDLPEPERRLEGLSGGELRRVDLACKLIQRPDVFMLDEPTNHIDTRSVEWIEDFLEHYEGSCVLVTHDRYFLDRVVNRIVEIEFNQLLSFPGSYERFLEYKLVVEDTRQRTEENRLSLIRRELAWYKRGPKARSTKQKARIHRLLDVQEEGPPPKHREFLFEIPEPEPLGKTVLEARHVTHGFGERILFRNFELLMQKKMRVGILGPNGCGKTTLLRVLMGVEPPRKGQIVIGDATQFLYVDQAHAEVNPEQTILKFVSDGARWWEIGKRRFYIPAYLERFLFDKNSVDMPVGNLSGGERNRLDMVRKLLRGGNFLVFDEPTNDLDLYTLRILEETIEDFDGCALIVSHDRYFLNRVCTHMLIFEPDGVVRQIAGNYDDYLIYCDRMEEERRALAAQAAPKVERKQDSGPKQRKLTFKEKYELEEMEGAIVAAEAEVERIEAFVQQPEFYAQPHGVVQDTLTELETAKARVATLFARWEELESLR